jgi:hypothetical protein
LHAVIRSSSVLRVIFLTTTLTAFTGCWVNELGNVSSKNSVPADQQVTKQPFDQQLLAACGPGGVTKAGTQALQRLPYLQKVSSDRAHLMWTTASTEAVTVRVTNPKGKVITQHPAVRDQQSNRDSYDQFDVEIAGLQPDTVYCYSLHGEKDTWLERTGFRTAPKTGTGRVRLIVLGDLGQRTSDQFSVLRELEKVPFDLALVAGDLAYESGTLSDYENNFFAVYAEAMRQVPFFPISGNHDYSDDGGIFREVFAVNENGGEAGKERWYSFDWGPVHVVGVDTEKINETQAAWLEADLAATKQPWRIVFMHRPAYSSGWHGSNESIKRLFVPVFEKHGVQLVFAGHDHDYERTEQINGVTYVVTGSGGVGTRNVGSSSFTVYSESVAHFGYVDVQGNTLKFNAIDASGHDFDTVTLTR